MPASIPNDIYQYSTITAFQKGLTDGGPPTAFLTNHGTHGIGTFGATNDDMIQVDSVAYSLTKDGKAIIADKDKQLPFVMVCVFEPNFRAVVKDAGLKLDGLRAVFSSGGVLAGGSNTPMPFRVTGSFSSIEMEKGQALKEVKGTIFGYAIPTWQSTISGPGIQCCFLSDPVNGGSRVGGRLKDFETSTDVKVDWAKCGRFHLGFPQSEEWETLQIES